MNTIIYRRVAPERFEQIEATVVDQDGKIIAQKVLWSQFAIERWAQHVAGPNHREIRLWASNQRLKGQVVLWKPQVFVRSKAN